MFDRFLLLGNSGPLLKDMIRTRLSEARSIREHPDFDEFQRGLPKSVNGFGFVDGARLAEVVREQERSGHEPDPEWVLAKRPAIELDILAGNDFRPARKAADLHGDERARLDNLVHERLLELWRREQAPVIAQERARLQQLVTIVRDISSAFVHVRAEATAFRFEGRMIPR